MSDPEELLATQLRLAGVPEPEREYRFCRRMWRFDFAWPARGEQAMEWPTVGPLAVEVEGAVWQMGRHQRPKGFIRDIEKYNEAVLLGWRVLRCTPAMVMSGEALGLIERALAALGWRTTNDLGLDR